MRKRRVYVITIYDLSDGQVELCVTPQEGRSLAAMLGEIIAMLYGCTHVKEISLRAEDEEDK